MPTLCHIMKKRRWSTLCRGGVVHLVPEFIHKYENNTYGPCAGATLCQIYFIEPCAATAGPAVAVPAIAIIVNGASAATIVPSDRPGQLCLAQDLVAGVYSIVA